MEKEQVKLLHQQLQQTLEREKKKLDDSLLNLEKSKNDFEVLKK
jgi:hypothetical protein